MAKYLTKYALVLDDEVAFAFEHFSQLFAYLCIFPNIVLESSDLRISRFLGGTHSLHPLSVRVTHRLDPLSFQVRYYNSNSTYVIFVGSFSACELTRARSAYTM